jgi:hypothetical protein
VRISGDGAGLAERMDRVERLSGSEFYGAISV